MVTPDPGFTPRVVLAKVGLDGHDRGVKVVARGLRDGGLHVIYSGMWQSPEAVVQAVLDEDADWLGISLLSGAHMTLIPQILDLMRAKGLGDVGLVIGGIIPKEDAAKLMAMGVSAVFGPGTAVSEFVDFMKNNAKRSEPSDLVSRFQQKDRRALSRLLTLASQGNLPAGLELSNAASSASRPTIALSGSAGVGKSSLIGRLVESLHGLNQSVAVLCCDPQSPVSGGALLGDRIRISKPKEDLGLFIRSLAVRGGQQAIASNLDAMSGLLHSFGFDTVIIETVGAGQTDTAIHDFADVLVVLLQPATGDELQWEKAGLLEVADVVVVNKADLPGSDSTFAQVRDMLNLPGSRPVPVLKVSSARDEGLKELWETIQNVLPHG